MRPGKTYSAALANTWKSLPELIGGDLPADTTQVMLTAGTAYQWVMMPSIAAGGAGIEQSNGSMTIAGSDQLRNVRIKAAQAGSLQIQTWQG